MPVGPAPIISTVSSSAISEIRAAQKPVRQDAAYEKRLFVADRVGNTVQSLIGMGHAHVLGLAAVDTAA